MARSSISYLTSSQVRIVDVEGAVHPRVVIEGDRCVLAAIFKRAFPMTHPDKFISIQDASEHEVGVLESLEGLPDQERRIVEAQLDRRYFTPVLEQILDLKQDAGMWKFAVRTQRGPAEFYVRNWRDSAHEAAPGRWQIHSVDGLRFEIKQVEELDQRSQSLLEQLF